MPKKSLTPNSYAMKLRETLVVQARKYIESNQMTQADAAKLMGVSQPRISDLMRNKCDKFSLDMLVTMLDRVGMRVKIST